MPLTIPDSNCASEDFCDQPYTVEGVDQLLTKSEPEISDSIQNAIAPCPNISTFHFLNWFWEGNSKSQKSREDLRQLMLRPDFNPQDLDGVNLPALDRTLANAAYTQSQAGGPTTLDGWVARTVTIPIPVVGKGKSGRLPTDVPIEGILDIFCLWI